MKQEAMIIAYNDRVEIWEKSKYFEMIEGNMAQFADLADEVMGDLEMNKTENYHIPVLLEPSINGLNIHSTNLCRCHLGGGGHSKLISDKLNGRDICMFLTKMPMHKNAWKASISLYSIQF